MNGLKKTMLNDLSVVFPNNIGFFTWIVRDVNKSIEVLSPLWGISHWDIRDYPRDGDKITVGGEYQIRLAVAKLGSTIIELIQPLDDKSIYYDFLKSHGEGLHHIGYLVNNWAEVISRLEASGCKLLVAGTIDGHYFGCVEMSFGMIVEFEEEYEFDQYILSNNHAEKSKIIKLTKRLK